MSNGTHAVGTKLGAGGRGVVGALRAVLKDRLPQPPPEVDPGSLPESEGTPPLSSSKRSRKIPRKWLVLAPVLLVAILATAVLANQASATPLTWDLAQDFRLAPDQANPSPDSFGNDGVWHYLQSPGLVRDPVTYTPMPDYGTIGGGNPGWQNASNTYDIPFIVKDAGGKMYVHPSKKNDSGDDSGDNYAIVGWKSPITGTVSIAGGVRDADVGCCDGIDWYIDRGSTNLASGSIPVGGSQSFSSGGDLSNVRVTKGEFIYVIVGPNATDYEDSTGLDLKITQVGGDPTAPGTTATPSPAPNAAGWNNSDVSVALDASDNDGGSGVKEITYSATGAQSIPSTTTSGSSARLDITTEGETTITYFARDRMGNTEEQKTLTVKLDKTAPAAPAITGPADDSYDNDGAFTVSGTAEKGSAIELFEGTSSKGTATADASGNWSIDLTGVTEGSHTYTARTTDVATIPLRLRMG